MGVMGFTDALMKERQSFGIQWTHNGTATTPDGNSYVFISLGAPDNGFKCIKF